MMLTCLKILRGIMAFIFGVAIAPAVAVGFALLAVLLAAFGIVAALLTPILAVVKTDETIKIKFATESEVK